MPNSTELPEKGQRVRVRSINSAMQSLPEFVGVVAGIEFRTDPPIVEIVSEVDGFLHPIQNFGNGSSWEPA